MLVWAYGVDLFRHGFPWEAHEAWERLWKAAPEGSPEKAALKGLIQLAAVLVTLELGHTDAATRLATRGAKLIGDAAAKRPELNGIALRRLSLEILAWVRRGFPRGAWPRTCDFELTGRPAP
jgi:predicted metal-dependent hydrolase